MAHPLCIDQYFVAFGKKNVDEMMDCYAANIIFFDPAFDLLEGEEVQAMWELFFSDKINFHLSKGDIIDLEDGYYKIPYTASYTMKCNGRNVVKKATANMKVENNIIKEHSDGYSLHNLYTQSFGFPASLIGWNSFYQKRIKNKNRAAILDMIH